MDHETKTIALRDFQWKAAGEEGQFSATFASMNVVDHHGDVLLPGLIEDGKVVAVGGYNHDMQVLPVGKAVLRSDEQRAWIDGEFNLKTQVGRDTYETVKSLQDVLEWSFVFRVLDHDWGDFDTGKGVVEVRYLKKLDVWSVDPVLKGAGIGTRTDSIKSTTQTFSEQADELVTAVGVFVKRMGARIEMRAKDGRGLSADDRTRIASLATGIGELKARLEEAIADAPKSNDTDLHRLHLEVQRTLARLEGVALPA